MDQEQREALIALGIDPDTGRKIRSDKGQVRGPNSVVRSDKGQSRANRGNPQSKVAVYAQLRGKLLSVQADVVNQPDYVVQLDVNGIYVPMVKHNYQQAGNHTVVNRARLIERTVKHQQGYTTDLEKYRWAALYELNQENMTHAAQGYPIIPLFERESKILCTDNTFDLMCKLYHIRPEQQMRWDYESWLKCYMITGGMVLEDDFVFEVGKEPGTEEFMPELSLEREFYTVKRHESIESQKAYVDERARVRDLEYNKALTKARAEILARPESINYTMTAITKMAKEKIDTTAIEQIVESHMKLWVERRT